MKKHLFLILVVLLAVSPAAADWTDDFHATYQAEGIDQAVVDALSEGYSPDQIMKTALPIRDLPGEEIVKALYCALAPPAYISEAAEANGVSEETLINGYELALAQCAEAMEEREVAAPAQFSGNSSPPANRTINNASPAAF